MYRIITGILLTSSRAEEGDAHFLNLSFHIEAVQKRCTNFALCYAKKGSGEGEPGSRPLLPKNQNK